MRCKSATSCIFVVMLYIHFLQIHPSHFFSMDQRLKDAAHVGDIDALYTLIREDAYLLDRIDQIPFVDTPLHIAASAGHVDFAMEMMNLMPSYARKLNQDGFSPMHLALQYGQNLVALELLKIDEGLVRIKGRAGVTPLHYIVGEGNLDLLAEFLLACPESVQDVTVRGETALHIAVINNRFEALQVLTGWIRRTGHKDARYLEIQVFNRRDNEGNTVLHLAAYSNQLQVVRLLLGCWAVNRNIQNRRGWTALDILQGQGGQESNREIKDIVRRAGGFNASSLPKISSLAEFLRSKITLYQYFATYIIRKRNNISAETRNAFLVVAVLIITTTYQTALSPPGGVWQGDNSPTSNTNPLVNTTDAITSLPRISQYPGTVVMKVYYFYLIWFYNTIALWLTIILTAILLPSGPYSKLLLWTLSFLCASYTISMIVISPTRALSAIALNCILFCFLSIALILLLIVKWRKAILNKIPEPRSELALEGLVRLQNIPPVLVK